MIPTTPLSGPTPMTDAFYKDRFKAPDAIDFASNLELMLAEAVRALEELSIDPLGRILTTQRIARAALARIKAAGYTERKKGST